MRYAIVINGVVANAIEWDGSSAWAPPAGATVVQSDTAQVGWSYANGAFTAPPSPPPPPPVTPAIITYAQAMRQLNVLGKLSAAQSAAQGAGGLTAALWYSDTWHYADFQVDPFKSMAAGLSIDPAAFFTAAALL